MSSNPLPQQPVRKQWREVAAAVVNGLPRARVVAAVVLALLPPLVFKLVLRAELPVGILFPALFAVVALGISRRLLLNHKWLNLLSFVVTTSLAVTVLIGLLITPYSVYLVWRDLLRVGAQRGAVSSLFTMIASLFSVTIAPMVLTAGFLWPMLLLALVFTTLLAVMLQSPVFFFLVLGLAVICLIYQAFDRRSGAIRHGTLFAATNTEAGRGGAALYSLLTLLWVLAIVALVSSRQDPRQIRLVNQRLHPALRQEVVRLFPGFPLLYGIPGYGFSYNESELGVPPSLSSRPIFEVSGPAGESLYLRTSVFDTYDGKSWKTSVGSAATGAENVRPPFLSGNIDDPADIRVTLQVEMYSKLPHTIDTVNFRFPERSLPLGAGTLREGIRLDPPLIYGDTVLLDRGEPLYLQRIDVGLSSAGQRRGEGISRFLSPYLQVPAELPREIRALARELADSSDKKTVLRNIDRHITTNQTYSLNPKPIAAGEDFVRGFLFDTKEGFCVHFATSFVILARLNGIPARYVTGFLANLPANGSPATVTGQYAHAWAEVWLDGEGWVHWEATRALDRTSYNEVGDGLEYEFDMELDRETSRQIQAVLGSEVRSGPSQTAGVAGRSEEGLRFGALIVLAALIVGIGAAAWVYLLKRGGSRGLTVLHYPTAPQIRFQRRSRRLVRRLCRLGIPPPTETGWLDWGSAVQERFPELGEPVAQYCAILCAYLYGGRDLDPSWIQRWKQLKSFASRPQPTLAR